jgi:hypothetical protein
VPIVSGGDAQLPVTPRAERRLILLDVQAPQPDHNVHDGRPAIRGGAHHAGGARVSRVGWRWVLRGSQSTLNSYRLGGTLAAFAISRGSLTRLNVCAAGAPCDGSAKLREVARRGR